MKITQSERETLAGPLIVGVLMGILATACAMAFASEYQRDTLFKWPMVLDATQSFFAGFLFAFLPFGAAPVIVSRLVAKVQKKDG